MSPFKKSPRAYHKTVTKRQPILIAQLVRLACRNVPREILNPRHQRRYRPWPRLMSLAQLPRDQYVVNKIVHHFVDNVIHSTSYDGLVAFSTTISRISLTISYITLYSDTAHGKETGFHQLDQVCRAAIKQVTQTVKRRHSQKEKYSGLVIDKRNSKRKYAPCSLQTGESNVSFQQQDDTKRKATIITRQQNRRP